jgi:asparagine synthase (glutamine-hydrolysing)
LAKRHTRPHLYTVGVEGSPDLRASAEAAEVLSLPWSPIIIDQELILGAAGDLLQYESITSPVVVSYELPLQIIASRVPEKVLMSGQGADELLGGYARYLALAVPDRESTMKKDLLTLIAEGVPRDRRIASHYGKRIVHPFLDQQVMSTAEALPPESKISGGVRKVALREVARELGLAAIAEREKKAAQYGSGIMKELRSGARERRVDLTGLIAMLAGTKQQS